MLALTWRLAALEQQASPARAAAAALGRDAASFGARLHQIGAHAETRFPCRGACDAVADAATRAQADLFLLFSAEKLQVGARSVVHKSHLVGHILSHVCLGRQGLRWLLTQPLERHADLSWALGLAGVNGASCKRHTA